MLKAAASNLQVVPHKKGGPKAAPSPSHLERVCAAGGLRTSPFKAGPKALQPAGCIKMTPRINSVNYLVMREPEPMRKGGPEAAPLLARSTILRCSGDLQ
jgi:hypothetical protein